MTSGGDEKTAEVDFPPEGSRPSDVLIALADPTRRAIFERLSPPEEGVVASLAAGLGITRQAVLKHLGILESAGLVMRVRTIGKANVYWARPLALLPLIGWLVGRLALGAGYHEAESERLAPEAAERTRQKWPSQARYRERKLADRLGPMSPEAAAVVLAKSERHKRARTKASSSVATAQTGASGHCDT